MSRRNQACWHSVTHTQAHSWQSLGPRTSDGALVVATVPKILRAMIALSGARRREIALGAGLRLSRLERILGGYVAPTRDEITMIGRACGADPQLVTTLHGRSRSTAAGGLSARTVFGLLLSHHNEQRVALGDVDRRGCRLSVDKLSVSFDSDETELLAIVRAGSIARMDRSAYRHNYRVGGVFVQHGPLGRSAPGHKRRSSRFEFNPARATDLDWKVLRRVLSLATRARITRLDVAVDLPVSVRRLQVLSDQASGSSPRKLNVFVGPGGVETIYVGARASRREIAMYDRHQERIDRGGNRVDEDHSDVTRIEARLRSLGISLAELRELPDPFAGIALVDLSAGDIPFLHALGAAYASAFGAQALRALVESDDFDMIVRRVAASETLHPSRVFADRWPRASARLLRKLRVS